MIKRFGETIQILVLVCGFFVACSAQQPVDRSCETVRAILEDASAIRLNMTRADLEETFRVGSFSFRGAATYVSKKCQYVAIDVEFEVDESSPGPPAPTDRVKEISKPYLAYPTAD